jgi:PKD repeat protein
LTYSWTFGDGGTASGTLTPTHTYTVDGTYTATLTVKDAQGRTSSSSDTVTVGNSAPTVSAGGPYNGTPGTAVSFSGTASVPDSGDALSYLWTFGDGATSTAQSPTHAYATAGNYTVTLKVTDSEGASTTATTSATVSQTVSPSSEPLLYQPNVQYVGAFRVPAVSDPLQPGSYTYSYGGTALAFNPANNSLFIVGMPYDQAISEISIPKSIVSSSNLNNLATASVLQAPVPDLSKLPTQEPTHGGTLAIGGLMVYNGQLIGTEYDTYDASGTDTLSHFVLSSLNLSSATVSGLYQVGGLGAGLVAGYMAPIPSEWQSALGDPYLTGQADVSIISRTSSGPAAFGFNPANLGSGAVPTTPYVYYTSSNPLGPYEGPADPLQNDNSHVNGVVFAPGTSTVLFFGSTGTNYSGYGEPGTYGDTNDTAKGPHSLNGQYALQVWAYNANDFAAVAQGKLQPGQVQPYDVWNLNLPVPSTQVGGVAFDPSTGRIYVSLVDADNQQAYTNLPLIEVFQVSMPSGAAQAVAPQIGTLAATPSTDAPGPVPAGTAVTLTAGNAYSIYPGGSVTQVAFYLDTNNDGVLQTGTDQLLGYGTPSTIPNANHNWTLTMSTSGMKSGTYTVFAVALDSDGLFSNPIATTLTIQ